MKTKATLFITALWAILAKIHELNGIEIIAENNEWLKLVIALLVAIANALFVEPKEAINIAKSIGGGGIKPPKK